jgi:hypothetical protein
MRHIDLRRRSMRKGILIVAVALVALAPAAQAKESKELMLLQVCGATACKAIRPAVVLRGDNLQAAAVPALQAYYVLRVGFGYQGKVVVRAEQYFVPRAGAVAGKDAPGPTDGWTRLPAGAAAAAAKAARGLQPSPAPMPTRAYVGSRRVPNASAFAALLGPLEPVAVPRAGETPVSIGLVWAKPNPWSSAGALLGYLPGARVVMRLDGYFRVPGPVADRIDEARR